MNLYFLDVWRSQTSCILLLNLFCIHYALPKMEFISLQSLDRRVKKQDIKVDVDICSINEIIQKKSTDQVSMDGQRKVFHQFRKLLQLSCKLYSLNESTAFFGFDMCRTTMSGRHFVLFSKALADKNRDVKYKLTRQNI